MMQMSRVIFDFMVSIFMTNPDDWYDPTVDFIGLRLIGAPFTPRPDLVKSDLTLIDDGLTLPFVPFISAYQRVGESTDGGLAWNSFRTPGWGFLDFVPDGTVLPLTIYGVCILGHDSDDLWFVQAFDTPVVFLNTDQNMVLPNQMFSMPSTMLITE